MQFGVDTPVSCACAKLSVPLSALFFPNLPPPQSPPLLQARLKFQDWLSLRLLPVPSIKLQKRFVIPGAGAGVKVSYECPLEELRSFWQPPARLMVSIESGGPRGFRLTQGGVEFDQRFVVPGGKAVVRAAGQLGLPPRLPLEEDEPLVRATLQRAGLKALW